MKIVLSLLLVIGSGMTHAVWNLFAKQSEDKSAFLWAIFMPTTIALIPYLVLELVQTGIPAEAYMFIVASLLAQSAYALLLSHTYKLGDLSQVYPVMRGTSTLLIPATGVLFLGESLPLWGWLGIGCMLLGFAVMSGRKRDTERAPAAWKPILFALSVGLCITCYTLIDKQNLQYLSPLSLLAVSNIGFVLGLTPAVLSSGRLKRAVRGQGKIVLLGSLLSPGSYLLFLLAMRHAQVSYIAPLREIGIVFGTLLGLIVLKERQGARRLAASLIVVAGIVMIAGSG
ncbi:DMT family transporter [Paenibacillus oleatilyticus]|uniref:DMT family transporter n=1 Tax=Paenibacillus oleatilyticus TaxID=2594886 RepID=A0ABV4UWL5_9BACL|nr:DMT family transporter [Paenibacillus oleatilyticus]